MPTLTVDGVRVHFGDTGGSGPAVLLFHAFPLSGEMWRPQVAGLRGRYRVLTPDLPGFGRSEPPRDPLASTVEGFARVGAAVLDACGVERAIVGGLSMGGYVTLAFARHFGPRVRALVLADTKAEGDAPALRARREEQQARIRAEGTGFLFAQMSEGLESAATLAHRPGVRWELRRLMDTSSHAGVIGALEAMKRRPDALAELPTVAVPTLVLVGSEDPVTTPAMARTLATGIPGAKLVEIPGAGHVTNLSAPGVFTAALSSFLWDVR